MNASVSPWAIETNGLTRDFGKFRAVDDVTFQVKRGSIFGFLGPNGSGKTTVVRMICGLLSASSGSAILDGLDVASNPQQIRTRFGYMNQRFSLYGDLTVKENLLFFGRCFGMRGAALGQRVSELLDMLDLSPYANRHAGMLSGGWKQRLSLGAALIHRPPVLFLDEPTAGIDPVARRDLWNLLFELSAQGITIFVTTHYMDEAERCSDIAYIYLSRLLVKGTPSSLKQLPQVTGAHERWAELYCASPAHALPVVRPLPGVAEATIFGETLHLKVNDRFDERTLRHALTGIQQGSFSLRDVSPSLEDVFASLTRQAAEARHA